MSVNDLMLGDYGALIHHIVVARNRAIITATAEAIEAWLRSMNWDDAVEVVRIFCRQSALPANVMAGLEDVYREMCKRWHVVEQVGQVGQNGDPAPPEWVQKWHDVTQDIFKYHRGEMASRGYDNGLRIRPIDGPMPDGWYHVYAHFCGLGADTVYNDIDHNSLDAELAYMERYRRTLAESRWGREPVAVAVTDNDAGVSAVGDILNLGDIIVPENTKEEAWF